MAFKAVFFCRKHRLNKCILNLINHLFESNNNSFGNHFFYSHKSLAKFLSIILFNDKHRSDDIF